ncbi:hypothetical protein [Nitrosarchaeum koreense]|uniref:Uncharacterized protein n=1 Tax=Nitrosarchaeum koreense MY1 TaxID=1001994 RepID=F9CVA4_9ARCH|nr:hypothetical protein [Nitrosarchaeum koreense]EGP94730.1 hypothetical protein MY1_1986 [Nitrosarchaeum koreense MY1]
MPVAVDVLLAAMLTVSPSERSSRHSAFRATSKELDAPLAYPES